MQKSLQLRQLRVVLLLAAWDALLRLESLLSCRSSCRRIFDGVAAGARVRWHSGNDREAAWRDGRVEDLVGVGVAHARLVHEEEAVDGEQPLDEA